MTISAANLRHSVLLSVLPMILGCHVLTGGWNGNWRLNPAKSHVQGGSETSMTSLSDGRIRLTNDAFDFNFRCDGADYKNPNGKDLTTSCIQLSAVQWELTYKRNGKMTSDVLWNLSADGTSQTIQGKSILPDGSFRSVERVYHRLGEGSGFFGRWQVANPLDSRPKLLSLKTGGNNLHFAYPEIGEYFDARLDGTPAPIHRPYARDGFTTSLMRQGPLRIHTAISFEGREIREGTMELSNDDRTVTVESWVPGKAAEKDTLIYEKQDK